MSEAIAIVGMAGRFPGAPNLRQFWQNLRDGVESIQVFRPEELEWAPLDEAPGSHPGKLAGARAVMADPEAFDAAFFNVTPTEAAVMDPQHRVFLETAWAALENAGLNPETSDGLIGVYAGASQNTYLLANLLTQRGRLASFGALQTMLASDKDFMPARVSYKLNLRGPSLNIQTACSTSLVAICVAAQSLLDYHCDVALAGGVSINFPQKQGWIYEEGGILSPDGHCRAFDAAAAGTVPGDGAGAVVLKRLSEAEADGDHIWAVLKGCGVNNDGARKVGFTAPSVEGQAEVIAMAQAAGGVEPGSISYVEGHGTATPLGDPIEFAGLTKAFGPGLPSESCALGSVKTNIGHLDVAAGVAGLIKTVLALHHQQIPPSLNFQQPNPHIGLAHSPFYVNARLREWPQGPGPRRAGVSSFGIGGTNAHVVLEESPRVPRADPPTGPQLLILSAKTEMALAQMSVNLAEALAERPDLNLADAAFTLQTGRKAFAHRQAVLGRTPSDVTVNLREKKSAWSGRVGTKDAAVVFLFPGQGAQQAEMARGLYVGEPAFRREIDQGAEIFRPLLDFDLRAVLGFGGATRADAEPSVKQTRVAQPALYLIEYALARLWLSWGVQPEAMIGHSLGEYVAAALAGVFTFEAGAGLVAARSRLMQACPPGSMLAVRMAEKEVGALLGPGLALAAVNGPRQCVISGPTPEIEALSARLASEGTAARLLPTSHAFHSESMAAVAVPLAAEVAKLKLRPPQIPFQSNLTGKAITSAEATDPAYWSRQLRQTVRFADGLAELAQRPERVFLEVGPGDTLTAMARALLPSGRTTVINSLGREAGKPDDLTALTEAVGRLWIAGVPINWTQRQGQARRRRVPLPSYPFERKLHRLGQGQPTEAPPPIAPKPNPEAPPARAAAADSVEALKGLFHELSGMDLAAAPATATFLELGFDSLFLTQIRRALQERFGVALTFRQLLDDFPTLEKLAAQLDRPRSARNEPTRPPPAIPTRAAASAAPFDLTEGQREIWFAAQMGSGASAAYCQPCLVRLRGKLDVPALTTAVKLLVQRHEALRITFDPTGRTQQITPQLAIDFPVVDVTAGSGDPEANAATLIRAEMEQPFDLAQGPLIRARLFRLGADHHIVALILHHIVGDGSTLGILAHELGELYSAASRGQPATLPAPEKFSEFVRREAAETQKPEFAAAEAYWLEQFADSVPVLNLPADRPRPAARNYRASRQTRRLRPAAAAALRKLSAERGCTSFTVLYSVFTILLHRLSAQGDLVVGVPAAAQVFDGRERLVGHCVNLLPLRSRLRPEAHFDEYLLEMRQAIWTGFEHWRYPFGRLLQKLKLPRDIGRVPLANVSFNLGRLRGSLPYAGLVPEVVIAPKPSINFDLSFDLTEMDDGIILDCGYSTELFDQDTIDQLVDRYETLLESVGSDSHQVVSALPLLGAAERQRILVEWNRTESDYDRSQCVPQLWAAQVARTPRAPALVWGREVLTYTELDRAAEDWASCLREHGVKPGVLVALCLARSPRLVIALLAVLKAGGAYVPLDPAHPRERLAMILEDAQPSVVLTEEKLRSVVGRVAPTILCLDQPPRRAGQGSSAWAPVRPEDLAYVIYTSGSTGRPKGVAVEHHGINTFLVWARQTYSPAELVAVLASTSICFDISGLELFVPLCSGGKIVLAENLLELPGLPAAAEVTLINTVPSAMAELVRLRGVPAGVITVNLGGEAVPQSLVDQVYRETGVRRVYDLYGPTEDTIYSTSVLRQAGGKATIGRPFPNKQTYILDPKLQPVPVGVPGELFLGGEGLARGYWNRPQLTAEKFIANPFVAGQRIYRTGDLARYLPDGAIEYLGRLDHQVKLRGFRIELGEIEATLRQDPAVRDCVVVLREDTPGQPRLVAYLAAAPAQHAALANWRAGLERTLPHYMVPSAAVLLEALPVTPNGKIDRKNLPKPESAGENDLALRPATPTEQALAVIWRDLLERPQVGRDDNFFELGGHSLLATQLIVRLAETFGVDLPLRAVFDAPQLHRQATAIEEAVLLRINALDEEEALNSVGLSG